MSAPAAEPVTADPAVAPAAATDAPPKSNEVKAREFAEKHGLIAKLKGIVYKKLGLKPKAAAAH